jgi:hypothetical protein
MSRSVWVDWQESTLHVNKKPGSHGENLASDRVASAIPKSEMRIHKVGETGLEPVTSSV